jgi:hypothetical protein
MSKIEELQEQVKSLTSILVQSGLMPRLAHRPEHAPDYIAHGSPQHAVFLGLVGVDDEDAARADGYTVYRSRTSGNAWRLDDEIGVMHHYPGVDPAKAALLVLRQKVNELESGPPQPPANAPEMFTGGEVMYA